VRGGTLTQPDSPQKRKGPCTRTAMKKKKLDTCQWRSGRPSRSTFDAVRSSFYSERDGAHPREKDGCGPPHEGRDRSDKKKGNQLLAFMNKDKRRVSIRGQLRTQGKIFIERKVRHTETTRHEKAQAPPSPLSSSKGKKSRRRRAGSAGQPDAKLEKPYDNASKEAKGAIGKEGEDTQEPRGGRRREANRRPRLGVESAKPAFRARKRLGVKKEIPKRIAGRNKPACSRIQTEEKRPVVVQGAAGK